MNSTPSQQVTQQTVHIKKAIQIPTWVIALQCVTFVVLYSVWILPEIAAWRNTSLGIGAALGLYVGYQYRDQLLSKQALPIWLIGLLFLWASFHLAFLAQNPVAQLHEFKGIWKRALLAVIFAFGLGLSIANNHEQIKKWAWPLIYLGLLMPTIIYVLKWVLTYYGESFLGLGGIPPFLKVYPASQPFYVPKTDYVVFCLPTLAVALGQIQTLLTRRSNGRIAYWLELLIYIATIAAASFVFYGQNIKNGFAYEGLFFIFWLLAIFKSFKHWSLSKVFVIVMMLIGIGFIGLKHIQKNDSWVTFMADAKIAVQLDRFQEWKYAGEKGYPTNEYGKMVSITNYERIAWGLVGLNLLKDNPLGYGLIEDSFGPLANHQWPESSKRLTHAHSGWLDLALGIGLSGIALVLSALVLALKASVKLNAPWQALGTWVLLSTLLLWCTTEVSSNGNFDPLLFWITLATGLNLRIR
jgi:hypothetical protein